MIPAEKVLIRYKWAEGGRQIGHVAVLELPDGFKPRIRDHVPKPTLILEAERGDDPVFERGACDSNWMQGDPTQTPAGVFGDMLLSEGFASWEDLRQALEAFANIEGCRWAREMLGDHYTEDLTRMTATW